jgi:hypothetical protein
LRKVGDDEAVIPIRYDRWFTTSAEITYMHDIANASNEVSEDSSLDGGGGEGGRITHGNGSIDDEQPSPTCNAIAAVQVVQDSCSDLSI